MKCVCEIAGEGICSNDDDIYYIAGKIYHNETHTLLKS